MEDLRRRLKFVGLFSLFFVILFYFVVGWRSDHAVFLSLIVFISLVHKYGFNIILALTGVIGWTILYDTMSFLPNYEVSNLHIKDIYDLELSLFGVYEGGKLISLCEWFSTRTSDFLSMFCGLSYLLWIPAPMAFAIFLVWKDRTILVEFAYAYLLTNVIGIIIYYLYPAAPPWYYLTYGDVVDTSVIGSEALLSEFDRLTGTSIFHGIYTKGSNIFGAVPSLHAAYPLLCLFFAVRGHHTGFAIFFIIMSIGTWLGAVYSQHHYLIDVLLGILCAIAAYLIMIPLTKTKIFQKLKEWYMVQLT